VRLTKVVHPRFALFQQWRSELMQGNCIHPFSDMLFCPVDLKVVTEELWSLCSLFRRGFFQLSGDADLSYASAAQLLAQCLFIDQARVQPVTTAEAGYTTYFPRHTSLACEPVSHGRRPEPASTTLTRIFRALEE
jgi:dTDP-4-dehydrorhamnose reductase